VNFRELNIYLKLLLEEAFFSPKCTKQRLAAGLHPADPLGKLTALPTSPSWINGSLLLREGSGGTGERGWERWKRREGREGSGRGPLFMDPRYAADNVLIIMPKHIM